MNWDWLKAQPAWRHYVNAFRDNLNAWAVWWPGSYVEVGDFGIVEKGCFKKRGSVRDTILFETKDLRRKPLATSLRLGGFAKLETSAGVEAGVEGIGSASAKLDLNGSSGVFLRANDLSKREFLSLPIIEQRLLAGLRANKLQWKAEWVLVHEVISAGTFTILSTRSRHASLHLRGDVEAIEALDLGKATAGGKVEIAGERDIEIVGEAGPIAIGLMTIDLPSQDEGVDHFMEGEAPSVRLRALLPRSVSWEQEEQV